MYSIYILEPNILKSNILNHNNKLSYKWWESVDIEPIDFLINKIKKYAYVHHIERLMYLGNWLLLNKIDPKEVYRIFMEWMIDSYDWVMVGNVVMVTYCSDLIMTRPYFSSSNYILKMSNFKKGSWCKIWDAVYYSFINTHKNLLSKNYATAMQVKHWNNKNNQEKKELIKLSNEYFQLLYNKHVI
jgi:deoxyribodipyrimidine photolyase-related protein